MIYLSSDAFQSYYHNYIPFSGPIIIVTLNGYNTPMVKHQDNGLAISCGYDTTRTSIVYEGIRYSLPHCDMHCVAE